jgi:uncharacterized protein
LDWEDLQKDEIILETFAEVLSKATYFQIIITEISGERQEIFPADMRGT